VTLRAADPPGPPDSARRSGALREMLRRAGAPGSFTRDVVHTFAGNVFTALLGFVSGVLLARTLGLEGRGQLAAIQALPLLVGSIGMLGLQDGIIYFGARERHRVGEYGVLATILIALFGIPIVTASYFALPLFLHRHEPSTIFAGRVTLLLLFANALLGLSTFVLRAQHRIPRWNALRVLPQVTWVLVIVALAASGRATPTSIALTYLAALFALGCAALAVIREPLRQGRRPDFGLAPALLRYSLPLALGSTPQVLGESIDRLIIAVLLSEEDLGLYSVAASWSLMMLLPGAALFGTAFSKIAGMQAPADQWRFTRNSVWASVAVSVAGGVALVAASPWIPRVFGTEFAGAVPSACVLVLSAGIRNVTRMLQVGLKACGRPGAILYSEWGGVIALFATIFPLIPRYGLLGAAWATVASGLVASAIAWISLRRWAAGVPH
jgi:O-antigen/teichoic acid export membrane protein